MGRGKWAALAFCLAVAVVLSTGAPGDAPSSRLLVLGGRVITDVIAPLNEMFTVLKAGTATPESLIPQSDRISETAWDIASQGRAIWCETAEESDFMWYQAYVNLVLAADCLNQSLRTGNARHGADMVEYLNVGKEAMESAQELSTK